MAVLTSQSLAQSQPAIKLKYPYCVIFRNAYPLFQLSPPLTAIQARKKVLRRTQKQYLRG
jgi:hypothetical protein